MKKTPQDYGLEMLKICQAMKEDWGFRRVDVNIVDRQASLLLYCEAELRDGVEELPPDPEEPKPQPGKRSPERKKPARSAGQNRLTDEQILDYLKEHPGQSTHSYELELHTSKKRLKRIMKENGIEPNKKRGWSLKGTPPNKGKKFVVKEAEPEEEEMERIPLSLDDIPAPQIDDKVKGCFECECWSGEACVYSFKSMSGRCKPYRQKRQEI